MTTIKINGKDYSAEINSCMSLLDFIRDIASLTGTKKGCNNGDCGSCTVLLEGRAVLSCMVLAHQVDGMSVTTIEGLAEAGNLHPVQRAFIEAGAIQCGYCTPGMVMAAIGLLSENGAPTLEDIRIAMVGHLCRCSGYEKIVNAVDIAARHLADVARQTESNQRRG